PRPPHPGLLSSWPKREGSQAATRQLGSNNRTAPWFLQSPLWPVRYASRGWRLQYLWPGRRTGPCWGATRAPSQGPRPNGAARGRPLPFGIGTKALNPTLLLALPLCTRGGDGPALGVGRAFAQHVPDDRGQLPHYGDAGDARPPPPLEALEPLP